jgi:hypothetical protein
LLAGGFVGCGTAMFKWRLDWWRDMLGPKEGEDVFFELMGWELDREVMEKSQGRREEDMVGADDDLDSLLFISDSGTLV